MCGLYTSAMAGDVTYLGCVDFRDDGRRFGIKREDPRTSLLRLKVR